MIAIDFIKDRRKYKRVYHEERPWWVEGKILLVESKVVGRIDWMMSRFCEHEFFAWIDQPVDLSFDPTKYHVFTKLRMAKMTEADFQSAIEAAILDAHREQP